MNRLIIMVRGLWEYLREVSGENDYARYCERVEERGEQPISPHAFYLSQQEHKHSRPTRCC